MRDLPYLRLGIRDFEAKLGRDSGLKVCAGGGMPKITLGITGLPEILDRDYRTEKPYWGPSTKCTKRLMWSRPLDGGDRYHCYWRALGEAAHFSVQ